ncbi:hypothetical protein JRQ81_017599, partial [Phrynocephalus forsythii]
MTVKEIKQVFGLEQFYNLLHPNLSFLVCDKKPKTVLKAAKITDRESTYSEARFRDWEYKKKTGQGDYKSFKQSQGKGGPVKMPESQPSKFEGAEGKSNKGSDGNQRKYVCFECLQEGHTRRWCQKLKNRQTMMRK